MLTTVVMITDEGKNTQQVWYKDSEVTYLSLVLKIETTNWLRLCLTKAF